MTTHTTHTTTTMTHTTMATMTRSHSRRRHHSHSRPSRRNESARASRVHASAGRDHEREHVYAYETVDLGETLKGTHFINLTEHIDRVIASSGVKNGTAHVISRHTTTAVTINEYEERLIDDARMFFDRLVPAGDMYLHNDLDRRHGPPDWPGGDEAWRAQEPENCHSHLLSMLIGNSESIPIVDGKTVLGTWQSCMFVELDGPRRRTVGIQVVGVK